MGSYAIAQILLLWALAIDPLQTEEMPKAPQEVMPVEQGSDEQQLIDDENRA